MENYQTAEDVKEEVVDYRFVEVDSHNVHQLCTACLCATRITLMLDDNTLKQYYMNILTETQLEGDVPVLQSPKLCWECVAHLKRLVRFRDQVQDSYRLLRPMCDKEDLAEFLQTSACCPGRLRTCCAFSIDISPQDDDTQVNSADEDVHDNMAAEEYLEINIEARPSTYRAEDLDERLTCFIHSIDIATQDDDTQVMTATEDDANNAAAKEYLAEHIRANTDEKPFKCEVCHKSFSRKQHLVSHKRTRTGEEPFHCEECHKSFAQQGHLVTHEKIHTGEKPFKCEVSRKSFANKSCLRNHIRAHTGETPYEREVCHISFAQQGYLVSHRRTHTGKKPFQCEVCHKSFAQLGTLVKHRRAHTGEKPFQCKVCHKSFAQKGTLINHIRIHTGEKPYQCEVCHTSFTKKSTLVRHRRVHNGEKPVLR